MAKRFLVMIALLMLGFYVAGCAEGDESASVVNPNPSVFAPLGSISGVVVDICNSNAPVQGAVVSVAYGGKVHQVTTAANGQFAFDKVPANWVVSQGEWDIEADNGYFVVCDLTSKTGYGYAVVDEVWVAAGDLGDGTNETLGDGVTEAGSGASTPVHKLGNGLIFEVGQPTASIAGTVYDVTTGRTATSASVSLYYNGKLWASTTTTTGAFSFSNLPPAEAGDYSLLVNKAGYEYASGGVKIGSPDDCGFVSITCPVMCADAVTGIVVALTANPARDRTVPYVVTMDAGDETDVICYDAFEDMAVEDIDSIVLTFSEAMKVTRTLKYNAVSLASSFDYTVTFTTGDPVTDSMDILADYTVDMTSAGVLTITPELLAEADFYEITDVDPEDDTIEGVTFGGGYFTLTLYPSGHLTDASLVPWLPSPFDMSGYLHSAGEAYQNNFIFEQGMGDLYTMFWVGDGFIGWF